MSFSKNFEPFYCIMDNDRKYYVHAFREKYDYNNDRLVSVILTSVDEPKALYNALQLSTINGLAETLHKLNMAAQINTLSTNKGAEVIIKEFIMVKANVKVDSSIVTTEEIVSAMDAARLEAQSKRQEKINALIGKIDAAKLTDHHVYSLEDILHNVT